jgi:hypothetical protein
MTEVQNVNMTPWQDDDYESVQLSMGFNHIPINIKTVLGWSSSFGQESRWDCWYCHCDSVAKNPVNCQTPPVNIHPTEKHWALFYQDFSEATITQKLGMQHCLHQYTKYWYDIHWYPAASCMCTATTNLDMFCHPVLLSMIYFVQVTTHFLQIRDLFLGHSTERFTGKKLIKYVNSFNKGYTMWILHNSKGTTTTNADIIYHCIQPEKNHCIKVRSLSTLRRYVYWKIPNVAVGLVPPGMVCVLILWPLAI